MRWSTCPWTAHLTVTIAYDAPVANWIIAGQSYLVDADGQILAARYRPDLELTIEDTAAREPAPGEHVNLPALLAAYQLQSNLPLLRVFPEPDSVRRRQPHGHRPLGP